MVGQLMLLITYYIAAIVNGNVTGTDEIAMYQRIYSGQGPSLILTSCTQPLELSGLVNDCSIKMFCSKCVFY